MTRTDAHRAGLVVLGWSIPAVFFHRADAPYAVIVAAILFVIAGGRR